MLRLILYELIKTFLKKRTYLGFLIVAIVIPLVVVAMKIEGGRFVHMATRTLQQDFLFVGNLFNGWLVSYQLMLGLWFHVPLLITFVAGDQLAGEATAGTYRLILTRPVSRTRVFFSKYLVTLFYTILFVLFVGGLSIGMAHALLGGGDLLVFGGGLLILPESEVASRFLLAYILAGWSILTIASIAFFFSSFVENAIGPIVATMGLLIIGTIIIALPLEIFENIRPYLFAQYMTLWQKGFTDPIEIQEIVKGVIVLGAHSGAALLGAWWIFVKKDILS